MAAGTGGGMASMGGGTGLLATPTAGGMGTLSQPIAGGSAGLMSYGPPSMSGTEMGKNAVDIGGKIMSEEEKKKQQAAAQRPMVAPRPLNRAPFVPFRQSTGFQRFGRG